MDAQDLLHSRLVESWGACEMPSGFVVVHHDGWNSAEQAVGMRRFSGTDADADVVRHWTRYSPSGRGSDNETKENGRGNELWLQTAHREGPAARLLHIVASPRGDRSNTLTVSQTVWDALGERITALVVDEVDVWSTVLPGLFDDTLAAEHMLMKGEQLDEPPRVAEQQSR